MKKFQDLRSVSDKPLSGRPIVSDENIASVKVHYNNSSFSMLFLYINTVMYRPSSSGFINCS